MVSLERPQMSDKIYTHYPDASTLHIHMDFSAMYGYDIKLKANSTCGKKQLKAHHWHNRALKAQLCDYV